MSLLDELKQQKAEIAERLERACADVQYFDGRMADLLLAIAALEPTPAPIVNTDEGWELEPSPDELFEAEKSEAREQLEREPEIPAGFTKWEGGKFPFDYDAKVHLYLANGEYRWDTNAALWMRRFEGGEVLAYHIIEASTQSEPFQASQATTESNPVPGAGEEIRDQFEDGWHGEEPAEHISILTGDPAIEPEAGLHEEAPALNADMQDAREQPVTDVAALIASGEHSYDEVAAIAYPEPDGYAPVTNPEADFWARGLAQAEPEKKHRFSIFGHKRETEDA